MHKLKVYDDMSIIEPKNKAAAELLQQWNDMMWQCEDMWEAPDDWLSMLESHPELGGSITVIDDLIQAVCDLETPNPMLSFEPLLAMAMLQIKLLLPMHPKSEVKWAVMDNRPALRVLGFLASTMIEMGEHETAVEMMEWLLRLNPNDNQGFRSEVVNAYLRLNRNQDAVDLCEHYPEDFDVSICYGHALALFRRGERQQADARLKLAIKDCPKVARALVRNSMKQPKGLNPGMVTCGGDDEAWYYREDARDLWLGTPEAMAWLKQCIKAV